MVVIALIVTAALFVLAAVAISNALLFLRLRRSEQTAAQPTVSILIPARDEAPIIGQTVSRILSQTYRKFGIYLLDDDSSDGTAEVASAAAGGDERLTILRGDPLPAGWLGKNWACHQLARAGTGDILVFTDADVRWEPDALGALVGVLEREQADLLTVWPTQESHTWSERLVVPLMGLAILAYLPILPVHHTRWPAFAAANGQCMAFRRQAYDAVGGHAAVRDRIVEDVALARRIKADGFRLRMADGAGLIGCRMYTGWHSVRDGFAKNILAGHGDSAPFLLLSTLFHWGIFIFPWLWLLIGSGSEGWPLWPLALIALGVGVRALTAAVTRQRLIDSLLMPVSVVMMTVIALRALYWHWRYGGPRWKGRAITPARSTSGG